MARFERDMTLKEVAAKCGMSATHISEVERGKTSPTIGALQRIAAALDEKPSHFVREDTLPKILLTRADERMTYYFQDCDGKPISVDVVSRGIPEGYMQIFSRSCAPGDCIHGYQMIGEAVLLCQAGMARITAGDETHVLREGDTMQLRLDEGYAVENIGEEEVVLLAILAAPVLMPV